MSTGTLDLVVLPAEFAVCRLSPADDIPQWAHNEQLSSVTRTADEMSVVCPAKDVPVRAQAERGWRVLKVASPMDFSSVGILASLAGPLAQASIPNFAISTFATDDVLVRAEDLPRAVAVLRDEGHTVDEREWRRPPCAG